MIGLFVFLNKVPKIDLNFIIDLKKMVFVFKKYEFTIKTLVFKYVFF
jgi:hypothetical protein